jgi:hypothetical protein
VLQVGALLVKAANFFVKAQSAYFFFAFMGGEFVPLAIFVSRVALELL